MSRPNIVLICADDLSFNEIGPYLGRGMPADDPYHGQPVHTPHIDSLAGEGALLTRYYATSAICTPSRYSILTGRLASRSPGILRQFPAGSPATITWNTPVEPQEGNLAKLLKSLGYATGFVGKWHNGNPRMDFSGVAPEADPADPQVAGIVRRAYDRGVEHLRGGLGFDFVDRVYFGNKEYLPARLQVHNLEWIAEGAVEFIDRHAGGPFFLYMATSAPHGDQFSRFWQDNPCNTPAGVLRRRPETAMPARENLLSRLRELGVSEVTAMAAWIDDAVGAVLGRLEALGLAENTVVVFTCDHLARGKYTCYEGSRVPFLVRWPARIRSGLETDALCANVDLACTLTRLAGGELPADYVTDGVSFADLLLEPDRPHDRRKHIYLECSNIRGIVTQRWKYIANRVTDDVMSRIEADEREARATGRKRLVGWDGRKNPHKHAEQEGIRYFASGEFPDYFDPDQLYDLEADPWEQQNLASDPRHAETLAGLKETLREELARLPHSFGEFTA
jgi:arylsulfatase A-like enzyme